MLPEKTAEKHGTISHIMDFSRKTDTTPEILIQVCNEFESR